MSVERIIADTSGLIGLGSIESRYAELAYSTIGISTTYTCFKELRNQARNGSGWTQNSARRVMEFIEDGKMAYPTRIRTPSAPTVGHYSAGEQSVRIAIQKHPEITDVLIYDSDAYHILERLQEDLEDTTHSFNLEPPNFPLFLLTKDSSTSFDNDEFCNQTEIMLNRMNWDGSHQERLFWQYPIDC